MEELLKDGEKRFSDKVPPGFKDSRTKENIHRIGGLSYEARFGDLIIWRQMINYAKSNELESIVFVTAERKEDWWQKGVGGKDDILGPLPELIEEFTRETNAKFFWIYSVEEFLQIFKDQADKDVSSATINEVKAVSLEQDSIIEEANEIFSKEINFTQKNAVLGMRDAIVKIHKKNIVSKIAKYFLAKYNSVSHEISDDGVLLNNPGINWYYKVVELKFFDFDLLKEAISSPLEIFLYDNVTVVVVVPSNTWRDVGIDSIRVLEDFIRPILDKEQIVSLQIFVDFTHGASFIHEIQSSSVL